MAKRKTPTRVRSPKYLLPADMKAKVAQCVRAGKVPKWNTAASNELFDLDGKIQDLLIEAKDITTTPQSVRQLKLLSEMYSAIPYDGILVGIVVNQAERLPDAVAAAKELGMPTVAKGLKKVLALIPDAVMKMKPRQHEAARVLRHARRPETRGQVRKARRDLERRHRQ